MAYIGLDVGTSGCKASVVDENGAVLAYAYREYAPMSPQPGYIEVDARQVWQAVQAVLKEAARPDVTALAIASFGEAVILLSERDEVLANSIYFCDIRGSEEVEDVLAAMEPARAEAITGARANPMYSANKLLWIKKHQPALYEKARHIMLFGDYIGYRLTGERVIDYSLASRTMLLDIKRGEWSAALGAALGLDVSRFSRPARTGTVIGTLTPSMASALGLSPKLLVVAGGHDQVLAALGGGAVARGDMVDGMGSSECISLVLQGEDWTPQMARCNFCCEPYVFENTYLTLAFNASSGTSTRWYRDCFEPERAADYAAAGKNLYQALDAQCPKGPTDLLFLPHVAGSGTPFMDSSMGGAMLGLRVATDRAQIYKAILEGICFEMQYNAELLMECGLTLSDITAVGGGSKSAVLMQLKADIMNRPIHTLHMNETGTLGLALLCAKATGDIEDLAEAARRLAVREKSYRPDPASAALYAQKMQRYRAVYPALKTIYQ